MASHTIDSFIFIIEAHLKKKKRYFLFFSSLQFIILLYVLRLMNTYPSMLSVLLCCMYGIWQNLSEDFSGAKLALKKAVLLLLQFWQSVALLRKEWGYRGLHWICRTSLLIIQSNFPSFSCCNIRIANELLYLMIRKTIMFLENLCLCPTNLFAALAQVFIANLVRVVAILNVNEV